MVTYEVIQREKRKVKNVRQNMKLKKKIIMKKKFTYRRENERQKKKRSSNNVNFIMNPRSWKNILYKNN